MPLIEVFGLFAIVTMVGSYALEHRGRIWIAVFAFGCTLAAVYAFLIQSYPFLVAEGLWAAIAARRWLRTKPG